MNQSTKPISGGLFLIVLSLLLGSAVSGSSAAPPATSHTFPETGHTVGGAFWSYWQQHGGLAQQGYPLSEEVQEVSDLNAQTYTVQYFERAVFEKHPENQPPYDVLLSQLGTFRYKAKYGDTGAPGQQASTTNARYFPETKHTLGGKFRAYWESHGGLAQQGYPISDEFTEVSDLNNQPYTVQYFERAVFELHPENAGTAYEVLLSQLGKFRLVEKQTPPTPTAVPQATETPLPNPNLLQDVRMQNGAVFHITDQSPLQITRRPNAQVPIEALMSKLNIGNTEMVILPDGDDLSSQGDNGTYNGQLVKIGDNSGIPGRYVEWWSTVAKDGKFYIQMQPSRVQEFKDALADYSILKEYNSSIHDIVVGLWTRDMLMGAMGTDDINVFKNRLGNLQYVLGIGPHGTSFSNIDVDISR